MSSQKKMCVARLKKNSFSLLVCFHIKIVVFLLRISFQTLDYSYLTTCIILYGSMR